jgi:PAS domain-containing protein
MKLLPTVTENILAFTALISALLVFIPAVRRAIMGVFLWLRSFGKTHHNQELILSKLVSIETTLSAHEAIFITTSTRLETIEKEMKFNGGKTIKDMLFLMFNYRRHDYWRIGHPVMEIDGDARVTLVSEATCRLFGVVNPDDLKKRSWLSFVEHGSVDDLLRSFMEAVRFQSEFNYRLFIRTAAGESRGEWELRASPISEVNAATKIYSSSLIPISDPAKRVAKDLQIAGLISCDLCQWKSREAPPVPE